jgi:hypothetical protein
MPLDVSTVRVYGDIARAAWPMPRVAWRDAGTRVGLNRGRLSRD